MKAQSPDDSVFHCSILWLFCHFRIIFPVRCTNSFYLMDLTCIQHLPYDQGKMWENVYRYAGLHHLKEPEGMHPYAKRKLCTCSHHSTAIKSRIHFLESIYMAGIISQVNILRILRRESIPEIMSAPSSVVTYI